MRTQSPALDYRSAPVVPAIVCNHPDDVAEVAVVGDYRLSVRFNDGTSGFVDLGKLIRSGHAGVFAELLDSAVFASVYVSLGAVTWSNGLDLAPDTMYTALRDHGVWEIE